MCRHDHILELDLGYGKDRMFVSHLCFLMCQRPHNEVRLSKRPGVSNVILPEVCSQPGRITLRFSLTSSFCQFCSVLIVSVDRKRKKLGFVRGIQKKRKFSLIVNNTDNLSTDSSKFSVFTSNQQYSFHDRTLGESLEE